MHFIYFCFEGFSAVYLTVKAYIKIVRKSDFLLKTNIAEQP